MFDLSNTEFPGCCGILVIHGFPDDSCFCPAPKGRFRDDEKSCEDCLRDYDSKGKVFFEQSSYCMTKAKLVEYIEGYIIDRMDDCGVLQVALVTQDNNGGDCLQTTAFAAVKSIGFRVVATFENPNTSRTISLLQRAY